MRITAAASTELFVGPEHAPLQVVRVWLAGRGPSVTVTVRGPGLVTPEPVRVPGGAERMVEVPVTVAGDRPPGTRLPARAVLADQAEVAHEFPFTVAEPGWRMFMVSHFHYDPVWWNTQAFYTELWEKLPPDERPWEGRRQQPAFTLIDAHVDMARRDPDYKFVLAELDYLKPYWGAFPERREILRRLMAEGRLELMGGTYNEPNTNLTSAESTARNAVYGVGYQRDVLGGDPATAWQLDVFGHDPQFPGMMAEAGLTSSSWARGPFHQWGPGRCDGGNARMQFPAEFEWVSPSGRGLLTSYMPNHYSAGWDLDKAGDLEAACAQAFALFTELKAVAATRNVLLPVGTDYTPPNRWITEIHRAWARRYTWPKFRVALPREFFAAVRAELASGGGASPQTRDMNPVYTGKDVSYIDTKQAQRDIENTLLAAEKLATVAALHGARYPAEATDKAWRQLLFGAHHDGITGTESDQVYLDLLGGWRDAHELAREALDDALAALGTLIDTRGEGVPIGVFNALSWERTDVARATLALDTPAAALHVVDEHGEDVPALVEDAVEEDGRIHACTLAFLARDVPAVGYRTLWVRPGAGTGGVGRWTRMAGTGIRSDAYEVTVDPGRGGAIDRLLERRSGREVLRRGALGNELLAYDEYPTHGEQGEGPWHLLPTGDVRSAAEHPAEVVAEHSPIGQRLRIASRVDGCDVHQEITLHAGVPRVDLATRLDGFDGRDTLFRVRFAADVPGGMPVSEVADAVVGRGFGFPDVDTAATPWTLDNPAYNWFALSATAHVALGGGDRAVSVAEVVVPEGWAGHGGVRDLVVGLVRAGVTSTVSSASGPRYGSVDADSNLPDVRIAVGGPATNPFTRAVLAADAEARERLERALALRGRARVWVPARRPLREIWRPGADLRGVRDLPVLVVAGADTAATEQALAELAGDLGDAVVQVDQPASRVDLAEAFAGRTVALCNRGLPGFNVDRHGNLHLSLMRSCSGWPSGVWLDPPRRTTPDGSSFQLQHWTHHFAYALVSSEGDWRAAGAVRAGHEHNTPLHARRLTRQRGSLPARSAFVHVEPEHVVLAAMKPAGNPMASMAGPLMDPRAGITLRCYEAHGRPAQATLTLPRPVTAAHRADLLEQPQGPLDAHRATIRRLLGPCEVATTRTQLNLPEAALAGVDLGRRTEPAQPTYADYWLHNRGAAPLGYQPVTARIPPRSLRSDGPFELPIVVASERTDAAADGVVEIDVPPGWTADPPAHGFRLGRGTHLALASTVTPDPAAPAGRYFVAARIRDAGGGLHEDVVTVDHRCAASYSAPTARLGDPDDVRGPGTPSRSRTLLLERASRKAVVVDRPLEPATMTAFGGELTAELETPALEVEPGGTAALVAAVHNHVASEIRGEAQLISPWGTWEHLAPWTQGFTVAAGSTARLRFAVRCPGRAAPVRAWALVKLGYFGRVLYTPCARLWLGQVGADGAER